MICDLLAGIDTDYSFMSTDWCVSSLILGSNRLGVHILGGRPSPPPQHSMRFLQRRSKSQITKSNGA